MPKPIEQLIYELKVMAWCAVAIAVMACFLSLMVINSYENPDWNSLGVMMAILQTFLAVVAVGGFWLVRNVVKSAAEKEAREEVARIAKPAAARAAMAYLDFENEMTAFRERHTELRGEPPSRETMAALLYALSTESADTEAGNEE